MSQFVSMAEYQKVCDERDQLAEELAWLKSEQVAPEVDQDAGALCSSLALTAQQARLIVFLYRARPRFSSRVRLNDLIGDGRSPCEDRDPKAIDVVLSKIRKVLGPEAIETAKGLGWRLTLAGVERTEVALAEGALAPKTANRRGMDRAALALLAKRPMTSADVGAEIQCSPSHASGILCDARDRGLARSQQSPGLSSYRRFIWSLTDAGRAALEGRL